MTSDDLQGSFFLKVIQGHRSCRYAIGQ